MNSVKNLIYEFVAKYPCLQFSCLIYDSYQNFPIASYSMNMLFMVWCLHWNALQSRRKDKTLVYGYYHYWFQDDAWQHIAFSWQKGGNMVVFLEGQPIVTITGEANDRPSTDFNNFYFGKPNIVNKELWSNI